MSASTRQGARRRILRTSELGLVERARNGDAQAFGELVRDHEHELIRLCVVITGDPQSATGAVQNSWQKAWRNRAQLRHVDKFRPWLVAVACNEARQIARRQQRTSRHEEPLGSTEITFDQSVPDADLAAALGKLTPGDRQLLALRFVAGLNSRQIGTTMGISGSGVRARLMRTVAALRKDLLR